MVNNSYSLAEKVNTEVNQSVTYMTDLLQYDIPEYWDSERLFEDCDGYALTKRGRLLSSGWPEDKIGLCFCRTQSGAGHVVTYVDTDKGMFILDNMNNLPIRPTLLNYTWLKILCGNEWHVLSGWS